MPHEHHNDHQHRRPRPDRKPDGLGAVGMLIGMLALLPLALIHGARRFIRRLRGKDPGPPFSPA